MIDSIILLNYCDILQIFGSDTPMRDFILGKLHEGYQRRIPIENWEDLHGDRPRAIEIRRVSETDVQQHKQEGVGADLEATRL